MLIILLFMALSCLGSEPYQEYVATVPMTYWFNTRISLEHQSGPVFMTVRVRVNVYPQSNRVRILYKVLHKGTILGSRELNIFMEDRRKYEE